MAERIEATGGTVVGTDESAGIHYLEVVLEDSELDRIAKAVRQEPFGHVAQDIIIGPEGVAQAAVRREDGTLNAVVVLRDDQIERIANAVGKT